MSSNIKSSMQISLKLFCLKTKTNLNLPPIQTGDVLKGSFTSLNSGVQEHVLGRINVLL